MHDDRARSFSSGLPNAVPVDFVETPRRQVFHLERDGGTKLVSDSSRRGKLEVPCHAPCAGYRQVHIEMRELISFEMRNQSCQPVFFRKGHETRQHVRAQEAAFAGKIANDGNPELLAGDFDTHAGSRNYLHQLHMTPDVIEKTTTSSRCPHCRRRRPLGRRRRTTTNRNHCAFLESGKRMDVPRDRVVGLSSNTDHPNWERLRAALAEP